MVDDWFDLSLYYPDKRVRLKAGFFVREAIPAYVVHGKKGSFLKERGDIQEDVLKTGEKPNRNSWGTEPESKQGLLHTEINGKEVRKTIPTLQGNYYDLFDGVYESIIHNKPEPVTAEDGIRTMKIIDAAIASSEQKKLIVL